MRRPVVSQAQQRAQGQVQLQAVLPQRGREVRAPAVQGPAEQLVLVVPQELVPVLRREPRRLQVLLGLSRPR